MQEMKLVYRDQGQRVTDVLFEDDSCNILELHKHAFADKMTRACMCPNCIQSILRLLAESSNAYL